MKNFCLLLSLGTLVSFSEAASAGRIPSSTQDIGVINSKGETILYYREGKYIIVKNCGPHVLLGKTTQEARGNCIGKSNKVPVEVFKDALRDLVSTKKLESLRPVTLDELSAYRKGGPSLESIESMEKELEKIENFIEVYGKKNADVLKRDKLLAELSSQETFVSAVRKINAEIEKTIGLISDETSLTLAKNSSDKKNFLYTVLEKYDPEQKFPCGLEGSVEERIDDCSYQSEPEKGSILVTRTKDFKEIRQDPKTNLLWSDIVSKHSSQYEAEKKCKNLSDIPGITWRLPSRDEFSKVTGEKLPNYDHWFWTSHLLSKNDKYASAIDGKAGYDVYTHRNGNDFSRTYWSVDGYWATKHELATRCVAKQAE